MDAQDYAIYETCSLPTIACDADKVVTVPNNYQMPSSSALSSVFISSSQNGIGSSKNCLSGANLVREGIPSLLQSESQDSKHSSLNYLNILSSNSLQNSCYSLQEDTVILEECKSKSENGNITLISSSGNIDNTSGLRLILSPLQYSNLIKSNSSDKVVTQTLLLNSSLTPEHEGNCTLVEEIPVSQLRDENWLTESSRSTLVNSSIEILKGKRGQLCPQVVIKPKSLQDEFNFNMVDNMSQTLDSSQIFEIIETEKVNELNQLPNSKEERESSLGTFRFLSSNDNSEKLIQQAGVIEDANSNFHVVYNCAVCNKFFSSEDLSNQHKKECALKTYSNSCPVKRETIVGVDYINNFSQTSNASNIGDKTLNFGPSVYWKCLVCLHTCSSANFLKVHYMSHNIEELATALLNCTLPCNSRNKKINNDTSTMARIENETTVKIRTEKCSPKIIPASNIGRVKEELKHHENIKEKEETLTLLEDTIQSEKSVTPPTANPPLPDVKTKMQSKHKKSKLNPKTKRKSKSSENGLRSRDPHSCPFCKKFLSSRGNLSKHLIQHQTIKPWVCKVCGSGFNSKRNHDHHYMQRHTTLRPNVCNICGRGYTNKRTLSEHLIFHKSEKEFECQLCKKGFRTKKCLNRHMQRHETNRKFVCKICSKAFRVNVDLASHMKLVHSSDKKRSKKVVTNKLSNEVNSSRFNTSLLATTSQSALVSSPVFTHKKLSNHIKDTNQHPTLSGEQNNSVTLVCNSEQLTKLKDFSDLLQSNSNSLLHDIGPELQSSSLNDVRDTLFISGDSIDTQSIIPAPSSTEELLYTNSYGLTLHDRTAILSQEPSSPNVYVMTGLSHTPVENSGSEFKAVYQESTTKENNGAHQAAAAEISVSPTILESITHSYPETLVHGEPLKFETATTTTSSGFQKLLKRNGSIVRTISDKSFDSNLSNNLGNDKCAEEPLPGDAQPQTLNLDLLSQTLQLDFQASHNITNGFI